MKYAVTGSEGFLGKHLCAELERREHDVFEFDRRDHRLPDSAIDLSCDSIDFSGLDGVFHLAGQPGVRSFGPVFADYVRDNLLATQRVFEAADVSGVRVVFASSSSVYGEAGSFDELADCYPRSPYGVTKLAGELLGDCYCGLDFVILRYFTVYGPGQRPDMLFHRICNAIRTGKPLELYGDGQQSRSFTYVSDAVAATILAMEEAPPDAVLNVGGGTPISVNRAIGMFEEESGGQCPIVVQPTVRGDVRRTDAYTERLRALGWEQKVGLVEGIAAQWAASGD